VPASDGARRTAVRPAGRSGSGIASESSRAGQRSRPRREREALLAELHALRTLPGEDALGELLVEGAALGVEARLRLLDAAEAHAAALVAAAAAAAGSAPARERRQAS